MPNTFKNDETFFFMVVHVKGRAVAVICEYLKDSIGAVRFIRVYAYGKALSRRNLYPFAVALIVTLVFASMKCCGSP
jgi:hypothetical protein